MVPNHCKNYEAWTCIIYYYIFQSKYNFIIDERQVSRFTCDGMIKSLRSACPARAQARAGSLVRVHRRHCLLLGACSSSAKSCHVCIIIYMLPTAATRFANALIKKKKQSSPSSVELINILKKKDE